MEPQPVGPEVRLFLQLVPEHLDIESDISVGRISKESWPPRMTHEIRITSANRARVAEGRVPGNCAKDCHIILIRLYLVMHVVIVISPDKFKSVHHFHLVGWEFYLYPMRATESASSGPPEELPSEG